MSIRKTILYTILIVIIAETYLLSKKNWQYYYKKGMIQYKAEMYDFSMENLIKAFDRNKKLYKALNIIADLYLKKNDSESAMTHYRHSLRIHDNQSPVHNKLGEFYFFNGDYLKAFESFKKAVKYSPENIKGNFNIARYFFKIKDYKRANKFLKISLKYGNRVSKEIFKKAIFKKNDQKFNESIKLFNDVIKINPGDVESYIEIYRIYRSEKNFKNAVLYLEKLKKVKPDYVSLYIHLGNLYFSKRFSGSRTYYLKKAIKNLKIALKFNPENPEIYFSLSHIYNFMGDDITAEKMEKLGFKYSRRPKSPGETP